MTKRKRGIVEERHYANSVKINNVNYTLFRVKIVGDDKDYYMYKPAAMEPLYVPFPGNTIEYNIDGDKLRNVVVKKRNKIQGFGFWSCRERFI